MWFSELTTEANPVIPEATEAFDGGGFPVLELLVFYVCLGSGIWTGNGDNDRLLFHGPPLSHALVGLYTTAHKLDIRSAFA